jgi:hydroxymethylpyrimidine/phosphomethylpyrimidine kinase
MTNRKVPRALTIAGSDSGGGAGVQADLKTFAALGVYGASAITAVTAQNTQGVSAVQDITPDVIAAQIDAVVTDIGADAVKTGMLSNAGTITVVAGKAREHRFEQLVVDPVMVAASGARLLRDDAVRSLVEELIPVATVVTPNVPEAEVLAGIEINGEAELRVAARVICEMGAGYVVVKGGHLKETDKSVDLLFDGHDYEEFVADRIDTRHNHGTGCTFASAIAAGLARGMQVREAVGLAKRFVREAMSDAYPVGQGHGPVNHFYRWWGSGRVLEG